MKHLILVCTIILISIFLAPPASAQEDQENSDPDPQITWTNEFAVEDDSSSVISLLKNFVNGFDSLLGGFIFYTPDPLAETITLKDGSAIPGVTHYRNIFYQIAIPILAIIISFIAITKIGSDNAYELKSFAVRLLMVIVLFLTVPHALSYSVQFNNLLVTKISETQQFTGFLDDYFEKSQERIDANESSEKFGIPSFDIALRGGIFKSLGKFIVQVFLFAITFLFLLCGFLYLGFQFVIRFSTLLFLGVIYPIVIPFALAERTQSIVQTFFKTWFTFLIQQPAFVLGFAIATDIFRSILESQGPSVGMLFFYTGFLFFLGGVNMLVARIFGDAWSAMSNNMIAAVATRGIMGPVSSSIGDFKKGVTGSKSFSTTLGNQIRNRFLTKQYTSEFSNLSKTENKNYTANNAGSEYKVQTATEPQAPFSQKLTHKGFAVQAENPKQGIVSVSGTAYKHDGAQGLSAYYPTMIEAVQDGVPQDKLKQVEFDHEKFIDLSSFNKLHPNPHNYNAMQEAKKQGKEIDYAYIKESSPVHKVRQFLELSENRNQAFGVKGVIVERHAKKGTDPVIRLYTKKSYEKHKNI